MIRYQKTPIILASASPRRKEIFKQTGLSFEVIPSRIKESCKTKKPERLVTQLAVDKAKTVAQKISNGLVIGADTIVVLDNKIIGKPRDYKHAVQMLKTLSNSVHKVYTGLAVIKVLSGQTKSFVTILEV